MAKKKAAKSKSKKKKSPLTIVNVLACPSCGLESSDVDPGIYQCVECGKEGFDCCVAGNGVACEDCDEETFSDFADEDDE